MLLAKETKGGSKRREILRLLLKEKKIKVYPLAQSLYGDGVAYYMSAKYHVKILERMGAIKYEDGIVTLTETGINLCRRHGIATSEEVESLLQNLLQTSPELMEKELPNVYEAINEGVVETCKDILNSVAESKETISTIDTFGLALAVTCYQDENEFVEKLELRERDPEDPHYPVLKQFYQEYIQNHMVAYPVVKERNLAEEFGALYEWINELREEITPFRYAPMFIRPKTVLTWEQFWDKNLTRILEAYDKADENAASTLQTENG